MCCWCGHLVLPSETEFASQSCSPTAAGCFQNQINHVNLVMRPKAETENSLESLLKSNGAIFKATCWVFSFSLGINSVGTADKGF